MAYRWHSIDELEAALRKHRGLVSTAAGSVGMTREQLHRRIQESVRLKAAVAEARELQLDRTEAMLFQQIDAGEAWAVIYYLKTQGKDRGYVETIRHQIDITASIRAAAEAAGLDPDEVVHDAEAIVAGYARPR